MRPTAVCGLWSVVCGLLLSPGVSTAQSPDRWVTKQIRRPSLVANPPVKRSAQAISFVGGLAPFLAPAGLFLTNQIRAGNTTSEAVLGAWLTTGAIKIVAGRARPYVSADTNAGDFKLWRGLRSEDYRAFPSGHATAAFAFAAALSDHLDRTRAGGAGSTKPALYVTASVVGLTRIFLDKHWPSDVLLGTAIGIVAGKAAARR